MGRTDKIRTESTDPFSSASKWLSYVIQIKNILNVVVYFKVPFKGCGESIIFLYSVGLRVRF